MTTDIVKKSGRIIFVFAIVSVSMILSGIGTVNADPSYAKWFRYEVDLSKSWTFAEVAGDPHQVKIYRNELNPGDAKKRVFVFYPRPSSAYDTAITSILNVFEEKGVDVEFTIFNFRKDSDRGKLGLFKASEWGANLIFSMGSESTAWLWDNYRGGDIPVVSVCSKDPVALGQIASYDSGSGTNFAFTSLNMPVEWQMAYIFELRPNLKNLGILVNGKNISGK